MCPHGQSAGSAQLRRGVRRRHLSGRIASARTAPASRHATTSAAPARPARCCNMTSGVCVETGCENKTCARGQVCSRRHLQGRLRRRHLPRAARSARWAAARRSRCPTRGTSTGERRQAGFSFWAPAGRVAAAPARRRGHQPAPAPRGRAAATGGTTANRADGQDPDVQLRHGGGAGRGRAWRCCSRACDRAAGARAAPPCACLDEVDAASRVTRAAASSALLLLATPIARAQSGAAEAPANRRARVGAVRAELRYSLKAGRDDHRRGDRVIWIGSEALKGHARARRPAAGAIRPASTAACGTRCAGTTPARPTSSATWCRWASSRWWCSGSTRSPRTTRTRRRAPRGSTRC